MDLDWYAMSPEQQEAVRNSAMGPKPPGVEQHLGNARKDNTMVLAVTGVSLAVAAILVMLRAYAKIFCAKRVRVEDALGLLGFGALIGHSYTVIKYGDKPGYFVHGWDTTLRDYAEGSVTLNLLRTFYGLFQIFAKNAIILEWIHFFVPWPQRTRFFWLCCVMIAVNTCLYISYIAAMHRRCTPVELISQPWLPGTCIDQRSADITIMVFNLTCDLLIFALPQATIWRLNLKRQQKIGLSLIFSLGLLTCACAAGRVHSTVTTNYSPEGDPLFKSGVTILWGVGESTIIMLVFCIPGIPEAFRAKHFRLGSRITKSMTSWILRSQRSSSQGTSASDSRFGKSTLNATPKISPYQRMNGSEVALASLPQHGDGDGGDGGDGGIGGRDGQGGIVKTTHFVSAEQSRSEKTMQGQAEEANNKIHPWRVA